MNPVFNRETYDIFPLVFPIHESVTFTVTAPSARNPLSGVYTVTVTVSRSAAARRLAISSRFNVLLGFLFLACFCLLDMAISF